MSTLVGPALLVCTIMLALGCSSEISAPNLLATEPPSSTSGRLGVQATVTKVIDGLTIEVESEGRVYRIRYLGLRIPEEAVPGSEERTSAHRALEFNRFLVEGRTVQLERGNVESDPNGNLIRYVYVDGEMVNKALLTNGYTTVGEFPTTFRYQTEFLMAEENAKVNRRGLWSPSKPGDEHALSSSGTVTSFRGGTLPAAPMGQSVTVCDYSGTTEAIIKGNVDIHTGKRIYHIPGSLFYSTTVIDEAQGDTWFCTETEAINAGWKRSKR